MKNAVRTVAHPLARLPIRLFLRRAVRIVIQSLVLCTLAAPFALAATPAKKVIIAYVFAKDQLLGPDEVVGTSLTRVNYAFANIANGKIIEGFAHDRENFQALNNLKKKNPSLEVVISVGGWTWSSPFSDMVLTPASRKLFIDSAVQFIRDNNLDGLDIDWEYPSLVGNGNVHRPVDKQNFTLLLKELRERFDKEEKLLHRHLITSIAAGSSQEFLDNTEMAKVQLYLDSVNLMAYDYYEPDSDTTTGHHAPLFTNPADPKHISADDSVKLYEQAGVPASKIVLGVPFYGHTWSDVGDTNHGLYQPGKKTNIWSNYHDVVGTLLKNGYTRYWDSASSAPYLYNASTRTWVSYEDPESLALKCKYVLSHDLSGIMFWDYAGDTADHALLNAINAGLQNSTSTKGTN
ncbi:glycoside hydrolase family 18 protein [Acidicapsa ligni]|uniref:glycoside hydrolase family 18 protein n=1 Tax=Acidicapsa ligni TaxID=542300 RepID=UPI0021E08AE1|nr:glycoside hydrolase family 18 protein [Acidicapsa ligni]